MLNPVAMSIITQVFTEKLGTCESNWLVGLCVTGISLGMGPIIGGLIVSYFSWRYVFFVKCTDHCSGNHPYTKICT